MKQGEIIALGQETSTSGHLRMFFSKIAMRFHNLATAALHGNYHGVDTSFFADPDDSLAISGFEHSSTVSILLSLMTQERMDKQ